MIEDEHIKMRVMGTLVERYILPTFVVALGVHGLIGYLLDIKSSRALSYLFLSTPLPFAYSSPEISAQLEVTGEYLDGHTTTRPVTRAELGKISGPFQRRTPLIYVFTQPRQLGAELVNPTLDYLFCAPGVALTELGLARSRPLKSISWRVSYQGLETEDSWGYHHQCQRTQRSTSDHESP